MPRSSSAPSGPAMVASLAAQEESLRQMLRPASSCSCAGVVLGLLRSMLLRRSERKLRPLRLGEGLPLLRRSERELRPLLGLGGLLLQWPGPL